MTETIKPITEILVPMDFSECSENALRFAKRIAESSHARLHLLFVDDDPILMQSSTDQAFRDQREDKMALKFVDLLSIEERERFRTVMAVRCGTAYDQIEAYVVEKHIDLIVMGNVGRSAVADLFVGSVTAHVIRHAACPVLSVRLDKSSHS